MANKRLRRIAMGLKTLFGPRAQGFFTPYRYADTVKIPERYPELEACFDAAVPEITDVLEGIAEAYPDLQALDGPPPRPRWGQSWFPRLDGAAAYAIVRRAEPSRIVEVGSGHSTRMLAHAAPAGCQLTCIDPEPRAALSGLDIDWQRAVLSAEHLPLFSALAAGDIAFFDSSHILWEGTDVDLMLARILPILAPGVLVHIHDVTLPDPYPRDWAWRGYTEQLGLAGYLTSPAWQIVWSSHYAVTRLDAAARVPALPLPSGARETSLWLRRA
ncbi:MAG: class I SAM-dependent methyltransferase [Pseudomonadota bacterium]